MERLRRRHFFCRPHPPSHLFRGSQNPPLRSQRRASPLGLATRFREYTRKQIVVEIGGVDHNFKGEQPFFSTPAAGTRTSVKRRLKSKQRKRADLFPEMKAWFKKGRKTQQASLFIFSFVLQGSGRLCPKRPPHVGKVLGLETRETSCRRSTGADTLSAVPVTCSSWNELSPPSFKVAVTDSLFDILPNATVIKRIEIVGSKKPTAQVYIRCAEV